MLYPDDIDLETRTAVFHRKLICWYLIAASYTYAARSETNIGNRVRAHRPRQLSSSISFISLPECIPQISDQQSSRPITR